MCPSGALYLPAAKERASWTHASRTLAVCHDSSSNLPVDFLTYSLFATYPFHEVELVLQCICSFVVTANIFGLLVIASPDHCPITTHCHCSRTSVLTCTLLLSYCWYLLFLSKHRLPRVVSQSGYAVVPLTDPRYHAVAKVFPHGRLTLVIPCAKCVHPCYNQAMFAAIGQYFLVEAAS